MRLFLALVLTFTCFPALADVGAVISYGALSDKDFYRSVSCGAPAGRNCRRAPVRWSPKQATRLSVAITTVDAGFPADAAARVSAALDGAIAEINGAGARVAMRRLKDGSAANVAIRLFGVAEGRMATSSGIFGLDGTTMTAGYVSVDFDASRVIKRARILFAADIGDQNAESIVLEELTQSLGLLFDIDNPSYKLTSIFAERGDAVTGLSGQDADAIRRHYPLTY